MANGLPTTNKSDTFKHFKSLHKIFQDCISMTVEKDLCPSCMDNYNALSNYYTKISNVNERIGYCIDIVDVVSIKQMYFIKCICYYITDE